VISTLLSAADIYEVEEGMSQAKGASESRELVRVGYNATGVQLLA
jgi:hypothetical protein